MKAYFLTAARLTFTCIVAFCGIYTLLILGIAQAAPEKGEGEALIVNGRKVGYRLEGQAFTSDKYFNGRPSAAGYNAAASSGSNKGPSNPEYLKTVSDRVDTFLVHNPTVKKAQIPSDLVTASGSGLDPDISLDGALVQADRVAHVRGLQKNEVVALIERLKEKSIWNGIDKLNVLQLNIELDKLKR